MNRKLIMFAALLVSSVPAVAKDRPASGTFEEAGAYWSNGDLPKAFKLEITMTVSGDTLSYHGVNSTDPANPLIADWSAKTDGKKYPSADKHFDEIAVHKIYEDHYLIEKYRDGGLVVGEFWRFISKSDQWIRHGVVAKSLVANGTKTYVEYFKRAKGK